MRIVIDMQGAQTGSRFRGIGRYTTALVDALLEQAGGHEVILVANAAMPESVLALRKHYRTHLPLTKLRVFDVPKGMAAPYGDAVAQRVQEAYMASLEPDVVLVTSLFEGYGSCAVTSVSASTTTHKTAVILYDLIPLLKPKEYLPDEREAALYSSKINMLKQADLLLAISESSCREAIEHLAVAEESVHNISAAVDPCFNTERHPDGQAAYDFAHLGITKDFVLYVPGGSDQRKNFRRLIEAYAMLTVAQRRRHQLVIASKLTDAMLVKLRQYAAKAGLRKGELVLTGYVEDRSLIALYSTAKLFVFPSVHEGFGLPALEAMACGAVVIGSDCSSIPEVIGNPEALFDPLSVSALHEKLSRALDEPGLRERLRASAKAQVARFTWEGTARAALEAIESLVSRKANQPVINNVDHKPTQDLIHRLVEALKGYTPSAEDFYEISRVLAFNSGGAKGVQRQLLVDVSGFEAIAQGGLLVSELALEQFISYQNPGVVIRPIHWEDGCFRYVRPANRDDKDAATGLYGMAVDVCQDDIYIGVYPDKSNASDERIAFYETLRVMGITLGFFLSDVMVVGLSGSGARSSKVAQLCELADLLVCESEQSAKILAGQLQSCDSGSPIIEHISSNENALDFSSIFKAIKGLGL
ncbi:mannosyltransferase [Pusillimonas sp. T7-7]|uniref:glycosyltransferase family 4 protein n=1 Tax=Pusillimonas sp. (strain T7-7) TaxID=1007105 RepID=UPI0002084BAB|nr:glycosyltransferase family 1 protein [Pusillimonas sp. T7-7]AEC21704.1 mannosyltransferase [Pusillimonas sp. T7-7]